MLFSLIVQLLFIVLFILLITSGTSKFNERIDSTMNIKHIVTGKAKLLKRKKLFQEKGVSNIFW